MSSPRDSTSDTDAQTTLPAVVHPDSDFEAESEYPPVPDPVEPRSYIEIQPTETALDPTTVTRAMALLFTRFRDATKTGLRHKLTRSTERPLVEWLLVSDGREDANIRYLVGTTHDDLMDELEGVLRTCVPNTYELRTVDWHPRYVEEHLPMTLTGTQPADPDDQTGPQHPAITPTQPYVAGVEYRGRAKRRHDWQTPLTTFEAFTKTDTTQNNGRTQPNERESRRVPLAALVEDMQDVELPVIYQVLCRPYGDQTAAADEYRLDLERGLRSVGAKVLETFMPRSEEDRRTRDPSAAEQARIDGMRERNLRQTFCVSARAVALTRETPERADAVARRLASSFGHCSGDYHEITGHVATDDDVHPATENPPGAQLFADLCTRTSSAVSYKTYRNYLFGVPHESKGMVVAPEELPNFCLLDGSGLTPNGRRAIATRTAEQTGITLPPPQQLVRYEPPGMTLCMPLTHDRQPYGQPLALKPSHQKRHVLVVGDTGAGKSVLMSEGIRTNVAATDGPDIIFDTKGGGTAKEYLRAHYATYGDLDDVRYFDLTAVLPALTFFDIEPLLDAGIPREEARSRKANHYEEILTGVMGAERFGRAVDSPKVIRNHVKALFDPIHGNDSFSHAALYDALRRTQEQQATPPVSDVRYTEYFENLVERDRDIFKKVLGDAIGRVDEIATDSRLAPIFEYVRSADGEDDEDDERPRFDFADVVNDDCVVIFDFGGMEDRAKRTLTLVLLSNLWSALKAREQDPTAPESPPLVNLYLEEAADVADTTLVDTLLSQGRSFDLSVTLGVQFPRQLESPDPENDTYLEGLRTAVGDAFEGADADDLKADAREAISREVREEAESRSQERED